ncbi:MAG: helix-turn-helix transcriptional regulator, partial [Candidatus Scatosoma sp.]
MIFEDLKVESIDLADVVHTGKNSFVQFKERPYHGFVFYPKGKCTYIFDDVTFSSDENTFIYLPFGKKYCISSKEKSSPYLINFSSTHPVNYSAFCCKYKNNIQLDNLFTAAVKYFKDKKVGYEAEISSIVYRIISIIQRENNAKYVPNSYFEKIQPAMDYLEKHYADAEISVETLAKKCNLSVRYFYKLFKQYYRASPKTYVLMQKIESAKTMLSYGSLKIYEIAENCGFSNVYHFSKIFKKT